jgi:hypothetical protein
MSLNQQVRQSGRCESSIGATLTTTHPLPSMTCCVMFMIAVRTLTSSSVQPCSPNEHFSGGWSSLATME